MVGVRLSSHLGLWSLLFALSGATGATEVPSNNLKGFALVELFTSEGCSSCPPADELFAKLMTNAKASGRAVYGLSFHVDYWDSLGWKDPFSDAAFTRRQNRYESLLGVRGPYTPQMVVNGTDQFVGADASRANSDIEKFLSKNASAVVQLQVSLDGQSVVVEWKVGGAAPGAELHVAWAQAAAASNPDRGENASKALRQVQVVREFRTVQLGPAFEGRLTLTPPELRAGSVVAFVQDPKSGRISGAAAAKTANTR